MVSTKDLPWPMIPGNWESISDKCFIGQHFTDSVSCCYLLTNQGPGTSYLCFII